MRDRYDVAVVGAGLAGTMAALHLAQTRTVLLVERDRPGAGASGLAAGLANPLMARKARGVWRWRQAIEALEDVLILAHATDTFDRNGVLRPAADENQARDFRTSAERHPDIAEWLSADSVREEWPDIAAHFGALRVRAGGCVDVPGLLEAGAGALIGIGGDFCAGWVLTSVDETSGGANLSLRGSRDSSARRTVFAGTVVLALGAAHASLPIPPIRLHLIKGQTVNVRWDGSRLPNLSGPAYIVRGAEGLVIGSSFQHEFGHLQPEAEITRAIVASAATMVPSLSKAAVVSEFAGIRVTVPGSRLPVLGPIPGSKHLWVFNGLGSKGLLMAPLLARDLELYLDNPDRVPDVIRPRTAA
jgi:glycine/D-amino acid oxidase-like deaminating enzyme